MPRASTDRSDEASNTTFAALAAGLVRKEAESTELVAAVRAVADARLEQSSASVGGSAASLDESSSALREKIEAACAVLCSGLVERETEVKLLVLAVLCGEHLLLLGPPG